MHYVFEEVFDSDVLRRTCDAFTAYSGMGTAILDLNGIIHAAAGWQDICTNFHRVNSFTADRCRESDTELANQLSQGQHFHLYRCKNGLVDAAIPIHLDGEHVGNFFTGQFLLEDPDIIFFERQAETHQFDKASYMEALHQVPVFKEEDIRRALAYLVELTELIGTLGLEKHEALELERIENEKLAKAVAQRTQELEAANARLKALNKKLLKLSRESLADS